MREKRAPGTRFVCAACRAEYKTPAEGGAAQREVGDAGWRVERWDAHGWCLVCYDCREKNAPAHQESVVGEEDC